MTIVLGIIEKEKEILIGKVKEKKIKNFGGIEYVFPGGKVKECEKLENAVVKEIKEETGLNTSIIKKIHKRTHPTTKRETHYFHCEVLEGTETTHNQDNDDIENLIWIKKEDLKDFMPTINPEIIKYLKK